MCNLSFISKSLSVFAFFLLLTACGPKRTGEVERYYCIEGATSAKIDNKMAEYLSRHLQARSDAKILVPVAKGDKDYYVSLHVADDFGGDFAIAADLLDTND